MRNLPHRCEVWRESQSVAAGAVALHEWQRQHVAFPCLIEAEDAWRQQTVYGQISGSTYKMSWQGDLRDGDRIRNVTDLAGNLLLQDVEALELELQANDTLRPSWSRIRPFRTGRLREDVLWRRPGGD